MYEYFHGSGGARPGLVGPARKGCAPVVFRWTKRAKMRKDRLIFCRCLSLNSGALAVPLLDL